MTWNDDIATFGKQLKSNYAYIHILFVDLELDKHWIKFLLRFAEWRAPQEEGANCTHILQ